MHIVELRTFLAIVDCGTLVRASQQLNVTQSTVTARLKTLEDELGQRLFIRKRSGAALTPAGVRLLRYAATISDLWHQARRDTALTDDFSGVCNIACEPELGPQLGQHFFARLRENSPQVAISIWHGSQGEVAGWLGSGKSDLAFSYRSALDASQAQIELSADELILVSSSPDSPIRFDPNYLYIEAGEAFGREHAAFYADADTARLSFSNAQYGLQHLLDFGGSGYLPRRLVQSRLLDKQLFELADAPVFYRQVYLTFNAAAREAWDWFDECVSSLSDK